MSIVINGGGVVGVFLALILSRLTKGKMRINLISAHLFEDAKHPSFDSRTIALTWGTYSALDSIGIWSFLSPYATVIKKIEISNYLNNGKIIISASDYKLLFLGYVIELRKIKLSLLDLLCCSLNIKLYCPAILKKVERKDNVNKVVLDDGSEICSKLLVVADGSHSSLAFKCGIRWDKYNYRQIAVISNIITTLPHNYSAFEKFTEYGSLALLPIAHGHSSLIWCCPEKWKEEISSWKIQQFCKVLQDILGMRLGLIMDTGQRNYYSLCSYIVEKPIAHRLVLIGNAAQTLHPFAGQGLNLSLRDVMALAKVLAAASVRGDDIGDYVVLNKYYQNRILDRKITVNYIDKIVRLFSDRRCPLILFRNLGFFVVSHSSLLHNLFKQFIFSWIVR
ncbi:2-octaprenyl-6-methoxyphenyl hydroxylase [Blochmannia endosymbiont of Camponotus (Colobopsis) obliquus]|uniref:2-octaprenyl-6-methoxyphenyl hydroxylase n=1 Tax=Blochmannia endosymbiont of Camponotus (Colobopsis) obliquus TaxID=1505597 RepID=UPI00061A5974|nr:2-octaprenyl-6-methoxyphenyl hydroxylase [Blochmannia endosymbiont of Camponotus (Colobopsis) obliquus]AKC60423.1 2-octaprenyl-6-methoxyphenol hydroxylase [Blochmannia endosymbiont of Camponotus (Colobopsis) obliquus]